MDFIQTKQTLMVDLLGGSMFFMSGKTKIRTARPFFNKSWPNLSVGTHIIGVEASAYVLRRLVIAFLNKDK